GAINGVASVAPAPTAPTPTLRRKSRRPTATFFSFFIAFLPDQQPLISWRTYRLQFRFPETGGRASRPIYRIWRSLPSPCRRTGGSSRAPHASRRRRAAFLSTPGSDRQRGPP